MSFSQPQSVLALTPIYREEMFLKLKEGAQALDILLDHAGYTEMIGNERRNVAAN